MNAETLAEAVNQLFYYEYASMECGENECVIDLSGVIENALDCHNNEFYISLKNTANIDLCEGGEVSLHEEHNSFRIYKIKHTGNTVRIKLK